MPRQNQKPKKHKQTTLTGVVQSPSRAKPKSNSTSPVAKRKRRSDKPQSDDEEAQSDDSDLGAIKLEPKKVEVEDGAPTPAKRRRRTTIIVESGSEVESDDRPIVKPEPQVKRKTRKAKEKGREKVKLLTKKGKETVKGKGKKSKQPGSDPEDVPKPRLRKLVRGVRPEQRSDTEDLESDEVDEERILESRFRSRDKKTEFQMNLEKLRRKKQGKPVESEEEEEEEEESSEDERSAPFKGAGPSSDRNSLFDGSEESDSSEGFIVEDDGAGLASLPVEFSMETHQDLEHHFKRIFQFFVHVAAHPAVERDVFMKEQMKREEYFSVPLTVARRKISGLRDSLVASSVWRPEFKKPLEAYPELDLIQLEFTVPGCDACRLGARMSTLQGRLLGERYNRFGFEDLETSDESSNDSESRPEFQLGRFCARRTRVYHDLSHWEYHLFKTISEEVEALHVAQEGGGFVRVAWAGGKQPPEDLQDADGICEWLDERKIIDMEWQKLRGYMERARSLEFAAKKGDDTD